MKQKFRTFPLNDLTGGINTRDYPSEIEDKQSLELVNWNFEGNKLVSSKGIEKILDATSEIRGFTNDDDDIYTITADGINKNNIKENSDVIYEFDIGDFKDDGFYPSLDYDTSSYYTSTIVVDDVFYEGGEVGFYTEGTQYKNIIEGITGFEVSDFIENSGTLNTTFVGATMNIKKTDNSLFTIRIPPTNISRLGINDTGSSTVTLAVNGVDFGSFTGNMSSSANVITTADNINAILSTRYVAYPTRVDTGNDVDYAIQIVDKEGSDNISVVANGNEAQQFGFYGDWRPFALTIITPNMPECLGNLIVSNLGVLITDATNGENTSFLSDGFLLPIGIDTVGNPTVGIIYEGKIILGGYEGKDNIVYSATDDPVSAGNELLDFSSWSAGAQSVSGGNKGEIVGFKAGENGLYVFKKNEVWYSNTDKTVSGVSFNYLFTKVTNNGALNQNCITEVDEEIFFYDHTNRAVRRLGYEENLTTLRDVAVSSEIENLFDAIPNNTDDDDYSSLINMSFKYPNLKINITSESSENITIGTCTYKKPNKTLIYNVDGKSWTEETKINIPIFSHKGFYTNELNEIYKDDVGNTLEDGYSLSKEYTFSDDVDYKIYGEIEVVGDIIPEDGETKIFTLEVLVDDVVIDLFEGEPSRTVSSTTNKLRFKEKIELYDDGEKFQFRLSHSGKGKVVISDVNIKWKKLNGHETY